MKKILFFILSIIFQLNFAFANLNVKTNIDSGEYNFPIEINIIANEKDVKIFYYTDGEGRIDNIKEFKKPILLKENTTIDYYATNRNYEDTLIKTSSYVFKYSNKIDIIGEENSVIIINNSGKIQNIGYWKVSSLGLNLEIPSNTFLENNESYKIEYSPKENEKLILYSPDNKIIKTNIYKKVVINPKNLEVVSTGNINIENSGNILIGETNIENSGNISTGNINIENLEVVSTGNINIENSGNITKIDEFKPNNNLKSSIIESNQDNNKNFYNILYIFIFVVFSTAIYDIYLILNKKIKSKK